jgi:hypothetical protein
MATANALPRKPESPKTAFVWGFWVLGALHLLFFA